MYKVFIWILPRWAKKRATAGRRFSLTRFVSENRTQRREECKTACNYVRCIICRPRKYIRRISVTACAETKRLLRHFICFTPIMWVLIIILSSVHAAAVLTVYYKPTHAKCSYIFEHYTTTKTTVCVYTRQRKVYWVLRRYKKKKTNTKL